MEVSGQLHTPATLPPGKIPWYNCVGGWVGPKADLDTVAKRKNSQPLPGLEPPIIQPIAQRYTIYWSEFYKIPSLIYNN
jgi:hypothetical protein